ncbi:MAG TPA: hypothetical protein VLI94_04505 [Solirubrobacterales bacterium]|nr:hypothetical protein [Solirubrobacterales bacterium]
MAVMVPRETWTDERLDDLANRMDRGFDGVKGEIREVKGEIRELRVEMNDLRTEMNQRFNSMDQRFDVIHQRFDSMQRTMIIGFVTMSASTVAGLIGVAFAT